MKYNRLGKSGIKVSELSFGSWITFGKQMNANHISDCIRYAMEQGVIFYDTAEVYENGQAEILLGKALKPYRRESIVLSTKIFFGGDGPNDKGLSRKHIIEGVRNSLKRLQYDYVDLLYCHRPDPNSPMEEIVLAMDYVIRSGYAFYWGTSEWSKNEIEQAYLISKELGCIPPTMEQPQYNLFHRNRVEVEYKPLYEKYGLGTTIWSPLASGILTGKYNNGIPENSRLSQEEWLVPNELNNKIAKVKQLTEIAGDINCTVSQLSLAWCLKNPNVSSVIIGASSVEQLKENLVASNITSYITPEIMNHIESIING